MKNKEALSPPKNKERKDSPVFAYAEKTRSRIGRVLQRGKEILGSGLKEAFSWALVFGIFSGTVNLVLGNPMLFIPYVLQHMGIGAVGGFGVGTVMDLVKGGKRRR